MHFTMYVKPGPGRRVRDPISLQHLPDNGRQVPLDTYWLRRLTDGDVVECTPDDFDEGTFKPEEEGV